MELSIIIPVFRETDCIFKTLQHLAGLRVPCPFELIVVDGEPARSTIGHLEKTGGPETPSSETGPPVRLLTAEQGRGPQMNAGAAAARGRLLFFLHADTLPDQEGVDQMLYAWRHRSSPLFCGAFDLAIASSRSAFRVIEKTASLRSRFTRIPYGDQGIFMSKRLFDVLGGYPKVPLMEDVGLMIAVKKKGIRPVFLSPPIRTSARRWERYGIIRTTLRNWKFICLYGFGVSPHGLAKRYYGGHSEP